MLEIYKFTAAFTTNALPSASEPSKYQSIASRLVGGNLEQNEMRVLMANSIYLDAFLILRTL